MPKPEQIFEKFDKDIDEEERGLANRTKAAQSLGAKDSASFIGTATGQPGRKFRVNYGYINEEAFKKGSKAPLHVDQKYINADTFEEAVDQYKKLGWLKDRDEKGRRYIGIEASDDDFSTEPKSRYFFDAQHW